ncbi:acyl-CoA dehydrogenase family protein [Sansalvadorimonas verongulae]|uniref:acyl-CoA dehydrogenase family protein n=1 Tax=Sansalvadorimonas verongulae TaxID=2172824 RepID=UPI0012BD107E|nr:acyl-CoA dehydrogenase family protein [Sansalvadorimonas verongulae]MTI15605.1 acyl-CoA dehydrogenase [Sansalvadorimonas verongulae]
MLVNSSFDDSHRLLRESVRRFVEQEILPCIDEWEAAEEFPRELYRKAGEAGFLGIGYPEAFGGFGGDVFHKVVFTEELMRAGSGGLAAGLGSHDIALPPINRLGSDALKEKVIPPVLRGEKIAALAITEPGGGSDVANMKTRAVREGDHYRVNGSKTFITSGARADFYTVGVRTGGEGFGGISLLMIEKGTPGFSVSKKFKKMGWRCSDTAELFFENCMVPVENLIGAENQGFAAIMGNFQSERLMLSLMANMTARMALEQSLAYVKEREAFGRPVAKFQVTRHKLADMATMLQASEALTYQVADAMNQGKSVIREVSMAKNFATDCSDKLTYDAVQLFGGMGFMQECMVERLYRDNRILSLGGGTREIMNEIISKQMGL